MALYNEDETDKKLEQIQLQSSPDVNLNPAQAPTGNYEMGAFVGAVMDRTNWASSLATNGIGDFTKSNPDYPLWDKVKDTKYIDYPEFFVNVDSDEEFQTAALGVERKVQQDEIFRQAGPGMTLFGSIAAGSLDPLFAIPGIGTVKVARTGAIATKTALGAAAATGGAIAAGEAVLSSNQPDRTFTDSLMNVSAGAIVGGALGGIVGKMSASSIKGSVATTKTILETGEDSIPPNYSHTLNALDRTEVQRNTDPALKISDNFELPDPNDPAVMKSMDGHVSPFMKKYYEEHNMPVDGDSVQMPEIKLNEIPENIPTPSNLERSAGAAEVIPEETRIADLPNWASKTLAVPGLRNLDLEGMADQSNVIRELTSRVFNIDLRLSKNAKGIASPISMEAKNTMDYREVLDIHKFSHDQYIRHLQVDPDSFGAGAKSLYKRIFGGKGVPSKNQWNAEVYKAMNAGDVHEIPGIQHTAQRIRKTLDKTWDDMNRVGLIPAGSVKPSNHFMYTYDIQKILENRSAFEDIIAKDYMSKVKSQLVYTREGSKLGLDGKIKQIEELVDTYLRPNQKNLDSVSVPEGWKLKEIKAGAPVDWNEAKEAAMEVVDDILSMGEKERGFADVTRFSLTKVLKPARGRALDTPYDAIEPWLVKDLDSSLGMYLNNSSNSIRMKEVFNDMGVDSPQGLRSLIKEEFRKQRILKDLKGKDSLKYTKAEQVSLNKLNDIISVAMGQFERKSKADAFFRTLRNYNYARLLGRVVWNSIADPVNMMVRHSLPDVIWDGLITSLKQVFTGTSKLKGQEMRDLMTAVNNEMDNIVRVLYDPSAGSHLRGPAERFSERMSGIFSRASGMNYWNNMWQRVAHNLIESKMLRYMNKFDKLKDKQKIMLRDLGISDDMVPRIMAMQKKYGYSKRGTHFSNVRSWSDNEAKEQFWGALIKSVRQSPIMPGKATVPKLFISSQMARTMLQFKTFFTTANSKIMLPMMQNRDMNTAMALIGMVGLGAINYTIGSKVIYNKEPDWGIGNMLYQAIGKTPIGGIMMDPIFNLVLKPYATAAQRQQFKTSSSPNPLEYAFGPSSGIVMPFYNYYNESTAKATKEPLSEKNSYGMSKKTMYQMKSLVPFQNLIALDVLRNLINPSSDAQTGYVPYGRH